MASVDYKDTATRILAAVGGEKNVSSATHCATRLRLKLRDESAADTAAVEKIPGVITVMKAGGQYQIVVGNNVPKVYAALGEISKLTGEAADTTDDGPKGNILNQFIALISSLFLPMLWPLAGAGLIKAFLTMATQFHWLSAAGQTYTILNACGDAIFTFLPIFLAVTAAKRFKVNQFTAMAIAGGLVYPSIVALNTAGAPVHFFGIPVTMMSYTTSVIPIIVGIWVCSYLQRFLERIMPDAIRNFMVPLLCMLIMIPLILITVGPITTLAANGLSSGVNALFRFAPWLAGAVLGGLWQVFVLFGLHWGLVPVMINDLSTQGYTLLGGPIPSAVLAQGAAMVAVFLRTRSKKRRAAAGPAAISAIAAGVTEPGIYGVNLPLKTPFYAGCAGGAVGGAIAAMGHSANTSFVFPSALTLPAYNHGTFMFQLIGVTAAMVIAFAGTFLFMNRESADVDEVIPDATPAEDDEATTAATAGATAAGLADGTITATADLVAPVSGELVALDSVNDKVFASLALGKGVGIIPSDGRILSPVNGKVITAAKTGHAYGLVTDDGVEVLIHVGIDTVQLKGQGFTTLVAKGDRVTIGQQLGSVDLAAVGAAGYDLTTMLTVPNTAKFAGITTIGTGHIKAGIPVVAIER